MPPSGIAVIRVSGDAAGVAIDHLTGGRRPPPRQAVVRRLIDPADDVPVDTALVLWLPGPGTVTGEDVAEFHVHGGRAVIAEIERVLGNVDGLIPAEPGEFTRRAFENGRIDLSQAEGLGDLLTAETESQRRSALAMAEGGLRRRVEQWQAKLIAVSAEIEAILDFSDEDDVRVDNGAWRAAIRKLASQLRALHRQPPAERLRDGVRVGIGGPPNAGKSTLFNALVGREAAIASEIAGTTRDVIEAPVILRGMPLIIIDTAGLRDASPDPIEAVGIERAIRAIETSDILLWLGDRHRAPSHPNVIVIAAKSDLGLPSTDDSLAVSALKGEGIEPLIDLIAAAASDRLPRGDIALNAYQRAALAETSTAIDAAAAQNDPVFVAEDLRRARSALNRITGMADTERLLDALFARFCIGK